MPRPFARVCRLALAVGIGVTLAGLRPASAAPPATAPAETADAASPTATSDASDTSTPTTLPKLRPSPFGNRLVRLRDLGGIAGPEWGDNRVQPADADEWEDIARFAAENFPNRWKLYKELEAKRGEDNPLIDSLRNRITARYRLLMRVQRQLPDLFDAAVEQGRMEDDAWAATVAARREPKNTALNAKMREKVSDLVKNLLQERQQRLDALKQTVTAEQERLDADRDDVDHLVDRQISRLSGDTPHDDGRPYRGFGGGRRRWDAPGPFGNPDRDRRDRDGRRDDRREGPATRPGG